MKRKRDDASVVVLDMTIQQQPVPQRPDSGALCDVASLLHSDLIAYGMLSLNTLLAWHQTCCRFYHDWCDEAYIRTLIVRALSVCEMRLQRNPKCALSFARVIGLDTALLSLDMAALCMHRSIVQTDRSRWPSTLCDTRYTDVDQVTGVLHRMPDSTRIQNEDGFLPLRLLVAFRSAVALVRLRHGWLFTLRRQSGNVRPTYRDIDIKTDNVAYSDWMCIQLAPEVYKR